MLCLPMQIITPHCTHMNITCFANESCAWPCTLLTAANKTISIARGERQFMQNMGAVISGLRGNYRLIGRICFQYLLNKENPKGHMTSFWISLFPQIIRINDTQFKQPPYQTWPTSFTLSSDYILIMQLIDHIHSPCVVDVMMKGNGERFILSRRQSSIHCHRTRDVIIKETH